MPTIYEPEMKKSLNEARRTVRAAVEAAGYQMIMKLADYEKPTNTMTASIFQRYENRFVLSCGCDPTLPSVERDRLWADYGRKLYSVLTERGFRPDVALFGGDFRTFVIEVA